MTTIPRQRFRITTMIALVWSVAIGVGPILAVAIVSFMSRPPLGGVGLPLTVTSYARLADPLYLGIIASSMTLALATTMICAVLAIPIGYQMAWATPRLRLCYWIGIGVPLVSNFIVRCYGIRSLFGQTGPLATGLVSLGFATTRTAAEWFGGGALAVSLGMITNYLPLFVLPVYAAAARLSADQLLAARDLGAWPARAFAEIVLPQIKGGIAGGATLVFVGALGEFVIPDFLGGARVVMLGSVISDQVLKSRDWPFAAALTMVLVVALVVLVAVSGSEKTA